MWFLIIVHHRNASISKKKKWDMKTQWLLNRLTECTQILFVIELSVFFGLAVKAYRNLTKIEACFISQRCMYALHFTFIFVSMCMHKTRGTSSFLYCEVSVRFIQKKYNNKIKNVQDVRCSAKAKTWRYSAYLYRYMNTI